ncbi:hypothetical protein OCK74_01620 [Chitinophagaceae bacterium LB-8]|uniref:Uncharacterized protein n=1 Tax=Paraflavisolibacter caeni TaxID=2982496 RepID=A0A9X2XU99_9BACT|nr:hypothetical protein [Paraflavisolibacter caeni]MCU7547788.1 hypothetical protein [Paraflavisolibacter caeni]
MPLFIPEESFEKKVTKEDIYREVDKFLTRLFNGDTGGLFEIEIAAAIPILENNRLISYRNPANRRTSIIDITPTGIDIVEAGGIQKYLETIEQAERERQESERLLALSTMEANEAQKKAAKDNKTFAVINMIMGVINIALLIWQLIKAAK